MALSETETLAIVKQLRDERLRLNLSLQQVVDLSEQKGVSVSEKTARKVLQSDPPPANVYLSTLQNLAVVLGVDMVNKRANEELALERIALEKQLAVSEMENLKTKELVEKLSARTQSMKNRLDDYGQEIRERDAHIAEQLKIIKEREDTLRQKDKDLKALVITLSVVLIIFMLSLAIHVFDPHFDIVSMLLS